MAFSARVLPARRGAAALAATEVTATTGQPAWTARPASSTGYGLTPEVENTTSTSCEPGLVSASTSAARPARRSAAVLVMAPCMGSSSGWYSGCTQARPPAR